MFVEVLTHTRPGGTMIELGAFWTFYSMWFLQQFSDGSAYMIEPGAGQIEVGKKNFEINGLTGDFTRGKIGDDGINITEFCAEKNIDYVDILHADIEGAELQMLRGISGMLRNRRVKYLFISTHSDRLHHACASLLKDQHYRIVTGCDVETETFCFDGILVACHQDNDEIPHTSLGNRKHTRLRDS